MFTAAGSCNICMWGLKESSSYVSPRYDQAGFKCFQLPTHQYPPSEEKISGHGNMGQLLGVLLPMEKIQTT